MEHFLEIQILLRKKWSTFGKFQFRSGKIWSAFGNSEFRSKKTERFSKKQFLIHFFAERLWKFGIPLRFSRSTF